MGVSNQGESRDDKAVLPSRVRLLTTLALIVCGIAVTLRYALIVWQVVIGASVSIIAVLLARTGGLELDALQVAGEEAAAPLARGDRLRLAAADAC